MMRNMKCWDPLYTRCSETVNICFSIFCMISLQEHLPYADDSNAVTPMSEENGAIVVPVYYANLGSRHSSYTSHASRISYTSHGDLLGAPKTKESQLRGRTGRNNPSHLPNSASPMPEDHKCVVWKCLNFTYL
jgi:Domain of unknown function (DUF3451).